MLTLSPLTWFFVSNVGYSSSKKLQAAAGQQASPEQAEEMTSPLSNGTWDSKMEGSMPEASVLSEGSEAEKNSRRAMILQMAKARMRHSSSGHMDAVASPLSAAADEWTENPSFPSISEVLTASTVGDFDLVGDLD
jgi:hypothetical protein